MIKVSCVIILIFGNASRLMNQRKTIANTNAWVSPGGGVETLQLLWLFVPIYIWKQTSIDGVIQMSFIAG